MLSYKRGRGLALPLLNGVEPFGVALPMNHSKPTILMLLMLLSQISPALAQKDSPPHASRFKLALGRFPILAEFNDVSIPRTVTDEAGNGWTPTHECVNSKSKLTVYKFWPKGAQKPHLVLSGEVSGQALRESINLPKFTNTLAVQLGVLKLGTRIDKGTPALGGLLDFGGVRYTNAGAGDVFDAFEGIGQSYQSKFSFNDGGSIGLTCEEKLPYLRIEKKRMVARVTVLPEVFVRTKALSPEERAKRRANDPKYKRLRKSVDKLALLAQNEGSSDQSRAGQTLLMQKADGENRNIYVELPPADEDQRKLLDKIDGSASDARTEADEAAAEILADPALQEASALFQFLNDQFDQNASVGIKLLNQCTHPELRSQLQTISAPGRYLSFQSYQEECRKSGSPELSEKAFRIIRDALNRRESLRSSPDNGLNQPVSDTLSVEQARRLNFRR
jgi:hypothetical protein